MCRPLASHHHLHVPTLPTLPSPLPLASQPLPPCHRFLEAARWLPCLRSDLSGMRARYSIRPSFGFRDDPKLGLCQHGLLPRSSQDFSPTQGHV